MFTADFFIAVSVSPVPFMLQFSEESCIVWETKEGGEKAPPLAGFLREHYLPVRRPTK